MPLLRPGELVEGDAERFTFADRELVGLADSAVGPVRVFQQGRSYQLTGLAADVVQPGESIDGINRFSGDPIIVDRDGNTPTAIHLTSGVASDVAVSGEGTDILLVDGRNAYVDADFRSTLQAGRLNSEVWYDSGDFMVDDDTFRISIAGQFVFIEEP